MQNTKFVLKDICGKSVRTLIQFLIFAITFEGVFAGIQIYVATHNVTEKIISSIGTYLKIDLDYSIDDRSLCSISDPLSEQIMSVEHVLGVNKKIADYAKPVNIENVKEYTGVLDENGSDSATVEYDDLAPDSIIIDSNISVGLTDEFRNGTAELIKGHFPDSQNPGALIEEHLAEQNNLDIDDTVTVISTRLNTEAEMVVVGIYKTAATFEITSYNNLGARVFAMSPYNRIYTDLNTGAVLFEKNSDEYALDIYVDSPKNMDTTAEKIKQLEFDWVTHSLYNMTASRYAGEAGNISALKNYSILLFAFCILIGLILLSIVSVVTSKQYHYDGSVLLAVGASKFQVIFIYIYSLFIIACAAFVLAVVVSFPLGHLLNTILQQSMPAMNAVVVRAYNDGIIYDWTLRIGRLPFGYYAAAFGIAMAIMLVSGIRLIIYYSRFSIRKVFEERSV